MTQYILFLGVPARIPSTQLRVNIERPTVSSGIEISVPHVFDTSSTFYSSSRDDELPQTPIPSSTNVSNSLASSDTVLNLKDSSFTALRVTIIIGCSLLILNLCIFAGVYYQRNENRMDSMLREVSSKVRILRKIFTENDSIFLFYESHT